ncbi:MAG: hypothetical protein R2844_12010 [Caldilineales bacterium]
MAVNTPAGPRTVELSPKGITLSSGDVTVTLSEQAIDLTHTPLRPPLSRSRAFAWKSGGASVAVSPASISLENGAASIEMSPATVNINNGALEVM